MSPEIFSFLQTQVNTNPQLLTPGIIPQENTGAAPGIFDALIAEYSLTENTDSAQNEITAQNHSAETSQPLHTNNAIFSGRLAEIITDDSPSEPQKLPDKNSSWQNLFADVKRNQSANVKRHENFAPQNDFDDGIVADDSNFVPAEAHHDLMPEDISPAETQNDTAQIKPGDSQHVLTEEHKAPDGNIQPQTSHAEITQNVAPEVETQNHKLTENHKLPENTDSKIFESSSENATPEKSQKVLPETKTQNHKLPENADRKIFESSSENVQPEKSQQVSHEIDNQNHKLPENADRKIFESSSENVQPEKSQQVSHEIDNQNHKLPENTDSRIFESSTENATPEKSQKVLPETKTQNHKLPENTDSRIFESQSENITPEKLQYVAHETNRPDNVTESRETSAEITAPEKLTPAEHEETPAKVHDTNQSPRKSSGTPASKLERKISALVADESAPENSHNNAQNISRESDSAEFDTPSETETPKNQTPTQVSNAQSETDTPRIKQPPANESPKVSRESQNPKGQREISDTNIIMAGFQSAQPAPNITEISEPQEVSDTPKTSRTPHNSTRKSQTLTRESPDGIASTDSESHAETSRDKTESTTQNRITQNRPGHEEISDSESTRPSESHDIKETLTPRESSHQARFSRTNQRTTSRNDTRRTEALNDFQAFFDSVNRVRRSPARVSTQPLSLRTGNYESDGTQSRPNALRNGIVNVVRFIRADGVRKANIIVDPPALGRISVELTSSSSGVEASVKVANEQIRQIVQDQFTQLRDNLLQQGVQVSEFTVDVQQDSSRQGHDSGGQNQRDNYAFTPSEDDDDTENFRADLEEGLLYWIA